MKFLKKTSYIYYTHASYPNNIWDGDSHSRDSHNYRHAGPDAHDWVRIVAEVAAVQKELDNEKVSIINNAAGIDPDSIDSVGTIASVSGLTVVEKGDGAIHKTILTLDEVEIIMTDGSTPATDAMWGTQPLYTFPDGSLIIFGGHQVYPLGKIEAVTGGGVGLSDTANLEIGVGTSVRGNASNFALGNIEKNIISSQNGVDLINKISDEVETSQTNNTYHSPISAIFVANLNIITRNDADAGTSPDTLKISGTITLIWAIQGNS